MALMPSGAGRRALLAAALCAAPLCEGRGALAGLKAQRDSESLLATWEAVAGLTGMEAAAGSLDLLLAYDRFAVEENRFGLAEFSDQAYGARGTYSLFFGAYALKAEAGWSTLEVGKDYTLGAELSRYWLPWSGGVLKAKAQAESRVNKENPLLAGLGLRTLSGGGTLSLSAGPWYTEASGGARYLSGADNAGADALLEDTAQVEGIPRNRILSGYLYAYRKCWKALTLGAYASWADSRSDFYRYLGRDPGPPVRFRYMHFPYDTPLDAYAFGGLVALEVDLEDAAVALGTWSAKTTFPFYSRRRQHWDTRTNLGIPMPWKGYYVMQGDDLWTSEVKVRKTLPGEIGLALAYTFYLKPYLEFGYLDRQSYRIHAFEIRISRG